MTAAPTLIDQLGGGTEVAQALNEMGASVNRQAVYKWKEHQHVPWRWRPFIAQLAEKKGISLPDNFLFASPERKTGS